jgi:hypothetical protein
VWERVALDEREIDRGLAEGWLVSDTRLRDAVRRLVGRDSAHGTLDVSLPTRAELDAHALESSVFEEAELVRYTRWSNDLEARVLSLERGRHEPVNGAR